MFLPRISIKRPVLATMMNLALILFGVIGLSRLPVRELPDIDPPIVRVTTVYPGANAAVVETEVTERLEEAINNIEGIKTLTSQSREQVSSITIEFDLSRDIDLAAQDVRDRVSRVRGVLPDEIDEPIVAKQDADANPIIWIGVNSERYTPLELTTLAERKSRTGSKRFSGVSSIRIGGEQRFAMRLWLDAEKMAAHQITVLDVQTRVAPAERRIAQRPRGKYRSRNDDPNARRIKNRRGIQSSRHPKRRRENRPLARHRRSARKAWKTNAPSRATMASPAFSSASSNNPKPTPSPSRSDIKAEVEEIRKTLPARHRDGLQLRRIDLRRARHQRSLGNARHRFRPGRDRHLSFSPRHPFHDYSRRRDSAFDYRDVHRAQSPRLLHQHPHDARAGAGHRRGRR